MSLQKWKLLSKKDVSPNKWFPIEARMYQLPNGMIIEDFTVTTLADVAMIIPITTDKKSGVCQTVQTWNRRNLDSISSRAIRSRSD